MNEVDEEMNFDANGKSTSLNSMGYLNPLAPSENVACWIHGNSFTWALLVPTMVLYAFSIAVFSRIAFVLTKSIDAIPRDQKARHRTMTTTCLALLALATLLGIGWPIGILIAVTKNKAWHIAFRCIFVLCTGTQGIFIFYSFCGNSKEAKLAWRTAGQSITKSISVWTSVGETKNGDGHSKFKRASYTKAYKHSDDNLSSGGDSGLHTATSHINTEHSDLTSMPTIRNPKSKQLESLLEPPVTPKDEFENTYNRDDSESL